MEDKVLIKEKAYRGKYVAIRNLGSHRVIASGKNPQKVYRKARKKEKEPLILFIPKENLVQIY